MEGKKMEVRWHYANTQLLGTGAVFFHQQPWEKRTATNVAARRYMMIRPSSRKIGSSLHAQSSKHAVASQRAPSTSNKSHDRRLYHRLSRQHPPAADYCDM